MLLCKGYFGSGDVCFTAKHSAITGFEKRGAIAPPPSVYMIHRIHFKRSLAVPVIIISVLLARLAINANLITGFV